VIILDTTVLVYAVGDEHPLREPCRRLLATHGAGRLRATTTIEVIQEFVHVRARRRTRDDAVALARRFVEALDPIAATSDDLEAGLRLFADHPALGAFDAVLAAVAIARSADALVSADRAFAALPGLRWLDPAAPEIEALLEGG
jgi:predicted nucleic acid-binding protein